MSLTEQIIEVVERGRALGFSDAEIDQTLLRIGCFRIVRRTEELIAYYYDQDDQERFIIISLASRIGFTN
jgi:hypothetical protein